MKNKSIIIAAFAAVAALASCQKEFDAQPLAQDNQVLLNVSLQSPEAATKATSIVASNETNVNRLQVFIFDSSGAVESYKSAAGSSLTLSTTTGNKEIYALVNCPDCTSISNKTGLLAAISELSSNALNSFAMVGSLQKTVTGTDSDVIVPVKRIVAKISIAKITANFSSPALAAQEFIVKKIYIINVAGNANYGLTAAPSVWYNKSKYESGPVDALTYDGNVNATVTSSSPHSVAHSFYCYPNPTTTDANAGAWSPRKTRLVVETTLGGTTYYYPITMPPIERNKTYTVTELIVTRPGSDDPDTPVTTKDCTYSVSVQDWETGLAPYVETI